MGELFSRRLMVLAFTDLVRSVDLKVRVGDVAAATMLARIDAVVREQIRNLPGSHLLNDTGDGALICFDTPTNAVSFGLRVQDALARDDWGGHPVSLRIGIHLGEVTERVEKTGGPSKVAGLAVDLAARVAQAARGGQILMTRSVYESARHNIRSHPSQPTTPIRWMEHGRYLLQGHETPVELFEVGVPGVSPLEAPADGDKVTRVRRVAEVPEPATLSYAIPSRRRSRVLIASAAGAGLLALAVAVVLLTASRHTLFRKQIAVASVKGTAAWAPPTNPRPPVVVDLSSPRAALTCYLMAEWEGDKHAAKLASFGTVWQVRSAERLSELVQAARALKDAAVEQFDSDAAAVNVHITEPEQVLGGARVEQQDADTALVRTDVAATVYTLKRMDGRWRVDLDSVFPVEFGTDETADGLLSGLRQATAGIRSGQLSTPDQVNKALSDGAMPELMRQMIPQIQTKLRSTTQPATSPS